MSAGKTGAIFGLLFLMSSSIAFFVVAYNLNQLRSVNDQEQPKGNTLKLVITEKIKSNDSMSTILPTTQTTTTKIGKLHNSF